MIKSVIDIREEFFDNDKLSVKSIKDLIWHIENDIDPHEAISLVTDAHLIKLVPLIAKHLDNEDDFIRQITVGCVVGRLELAEYAEKALNMAQSDPYSGPRSLATSSLGVVINKVNPVLKKQIANYLYNVIISPEYENSHKRCAFDSILDAMDISVPQRLAVGYDENHDLVKKFKIKYLS
jgi:hypothetical protein